MASSSSPEPQQVNVMDLDVPQLADVRRQLGRGGPLASQAILRPAFLLIHTRTQELSHHSNSYTQLRQAQAKFRSCIENVGQVKPENKDKTILVPLTNSLYVPGKLSDTEYVIVDVGTGLAQYESKVEFIRTNLEALQEMITKKQENMNYLINGPV
ncbi:Prefoldin-domain-containing protein [Lentinus tigrinus ALCF2SS1-7]|uniref:Prefoldin-domain-containing protein n=1 Tax=Lentinus tigrinus ALCF2SS1-6 TaxID=1328759 RepID=A0A5C2RSU5_9APHY|nr:Prefoldin-domain-containing protein [Lentinus tigrinus ALCF2SS1-6]RPD73674.1 Prefoldin-domain-containing protein [Lentinus tigrinus ALCF2SS1-7]